MDQWHRRGRQGTLYVGDSDNSLIRLVTPTAAALTFATATAVGTTDTIDAPQVVTVANIGNAPLVFQPFVAGNLSNAALAASTPAGCAALSPLQLASGTDCTLTIEFAPTAVGSLTGSVNVLDNALNGAATQPIPLSGIGSTGLVATVGVPSTVTLAYGAGGSIPVTVTGTEQRRAVA